MLICNCPFGYLHLLSNEFINSENQELLAFVAHSLASAVTRWRNRRERLALQKMQAGVSTLKPEGNWFQTCATILQDITRAKLCIAFQASRDNTVKAVAIAPFGPPLDKIVGSPKSVLRRCIQSGKIIRIGDFQDQEQRRKITGTDEYDQQLEANVGTLIGDRVRSFLAAPVVVEGHVVSILALFNKQGYLPEQFTETDLKIISSACGFLAGVIPSVEMTRTMENLSKVFSTVDLEDVKQHLQLFETLYIFYLHA